MKDLKTNFIRYVITRSDKDFNRIYPDLNACIDIALNSIDTTKEDKEDLKQEIFIKFISKNQKKIDRFNAKIEENKGKAEKELKALTFQVDLWNKWTKESDIISRYDLRKPWIVVDDQNFAYIDLLEAREGSFRSLLIYIAHNYALDIIRADLKRRDIELSAAKDGRL
jgi:hypothetical protein